VPESAALHQPHGSFNPTLEPNDQMPQSYDQKAIDVPPLAPLNAIPGVTDLIEGLHRQPLLLWLSKETWTCGTYLGSSETDILDWLYGSLVLDRAAMASLNECPGIGESLARDMERHANTDRHE
jgi:hypothetical protein